MAHFSFSSESNEWYTPPRYVLAARRALGGVISLDPASNARANKLVQAERYFNWRHDGLRQQWLAETVFCNPPYGTRDGVSNKRWWSEKMVSEYLAGNFHAGILLLTASTGERWFRPLWQFPICFTDHRIKYIAHHSAWCQTCPPAAARSSILARTCAGSFHRFKTLARACGRHTERQRDGER